MSSRFRKGVDYDCQTQSVQGHTAVGDAQNALPSLRRSNSEPRRLYASIGTNEIYQRRCRRSFGALSGLAVPILGHFPICSPGPRDAKHLPRWNFNSTFPLPSVAAGGSPDPRLLAFPRLGLSAGTSYAFAASLLALFGFKFKPETGNTDLSTLMRIL